MGQRRKSALVEADARAGAKPLTRTPNEGASTVHSPGHRETLSTMGVGDLRDPSKVLALQRSIGNRATVALLRRVTPREHSPAKVSASGTRPVVRRLVTKQHNAKATAILNKVSKGEPGSILVVPDDFSLGTSNPGVTLRGNNLGYMQGLLRSFLKGYTDPNEAATAIEGLRDDSILITEKVFSGDEVFQNGVVFHEWGHVTGSSTEEAGVFATELEQMQAHFGTEKTRQYMAVRSVPYYKQATVSQGTGVDRLRAILATLREGADIGTAALIQDVIDYLAVKKEDTKKGVAALQVLGVSDQGDGAHPSGELPIPKEGFLQVLDKLPLLLPPETGKNVFSKPNMYIRIKVGDGQYRIRAGQDYLNTGTSQRYLADAAEIRGAKTQLKKPSLGRSDEPPADVRVVGDGHHRLVWSAFHNQPVAFESKNQFAPGQDWRLTYKELPGTSQPAATGTKGTPRNPPPGKKDQPPKRDIKD